MSSRFLPTPHSFVAASPPLRTRFGVIAALLVSLSLGGCLRGATPAAVSGIVEAHRVTVASEAAGRVLTVAAREGSAVTAGDVLLTLDCTIPTAQRDQAQAGVTAAEAQVAQAAAQQQLVADGARPQELDAAAADVAAAQQALRMARRGATDDQRAQLEAALEGIRARKTLAELTVQRIDVLSGVGSSTEAQRDAAHAELAVLSAEEDRVAAALAEAESGARSEEVAILEQRLQQAQARLSALEEGARVPERTSIDAVHAAALAQQQAATSVLAAAQAQVDRCTVRAPVTGQIDIVAIDAGEFVSPGTPLVALSPEGTLQVRTWVPQNQLGALATGTQVPVVPDGIALEQPLWATVQRIADQAEFTAGNVQTPDDRMLLVYRMDLDLPADAQGVRPGMTVSVDLSAARPAEGSR